MDKAAIGPATWIFQSSFATRLTGNILRVTRGESEARLLVKVLILFRPTIEFKEVNNCIYNKRNGYERGLTSQQMRRIKIPPLRPATSTVNEADCNPC